MERSKIQPPPYEYPPQWISPEERRYHPDYNGDMKHFLPRLVKLRRSKVTDTLGFNIRGGREHSCGIFISKVMPNTDAERLGLKEGDQILSVNEYNFEDIEHSKAVKILKSHTDIEMQIRFFPYGYGKTYERSTLSSHGSLSSPQ
ncbi:PDZ domain-containing protein 11-like isoform X1 [Centruroides sculpturatus]|uniref:PDZ domain-containing protein 11-like isoform X1 n=1 Tax=Centruroides sculpturatus TaxID=218467 RepID=UPI000C6D3590|nr:PDZ domain-containing protein 11-like isoform X1 [Centruroides sculpturatus]XP_023243784.1 PDZ domain-containing protein 11-like isoform X1 [Centruroides sculpturatus]XP_023243786.1 PDZ domain-containing protein 11-like isoform X1 [Centruroides sculpturatus]XP_023243787.1 PDZ domain-containing protein 11-like isoform X1 [Centruroides sculpturatus]XP_023243788.1 PDZ domain-containing protein 11-like isoform X1 [Centruroides sculpturatus]XP_023243789.1 PDZ domain-containing protein 11-like is